MSNELKAWFSHKFRIFESNGSGLNVKIYRMEINSSFDVSDSIRQGDFSHGIILYYESIRFFANSMTGRDAERFEQEEWENLRLMLKKCYEERAALKSLME
jgi:hypothetical protein